MKDNLKRLIAELESFVPSTVDARAKIEHRRNSPHPSCNTLAERVPLAHSTSVTGFQRICEVGRILSLRALVSSGHLAPKDGFKTPVEATLGTEGFAFTYAAPFRYPHTLCGILFAPSLETIRSDGIATPFDSGAIVHYLRPHDDAVSQRAFLAAHDLPANEYRNLLRREVQLLFASPEHYVDGTGPDVGWYLDVLGGDQRRWTFEVRFPHSIVLAAELMAVFVPTAIAARDWFEPIHADCYRRGVDVVVFPSPSSTFLDLQRRCVQYIWRKCANDPEDVAR